MRGIVKWINIIAGILCLAVLAGGFLYVRSILGDQGQSQLQRSKLDFLANRFRSASYPEVRPQKKQVLEPEEKSTIQPAKKILLRGRILGVSLRPLNLSLVGKSASGEKKTFEKEGGWFSSSFQNVSGIKIGVAERKAWLGPLTVSKGDSEVRFNWVVAELKKGALYLSDVAAFEVGSKLKLFFHGKAELPTGSKLVAALSQGKHRWCASETTVENGTFKGVLEPLEEYYPSGKYLFSIEFNPLLQDRYVLEGESDQEIFERSEKNLGKAPQEEEGISEVRENPWLKYPETEVQLEIYVGDPAVEKEQWQQEISQFKAICLRGKLIRRTFLALRDLGIAAKGSYWALEQRVLRWSPDIKPNLSKQGQLDVKAWRFWVDQVFLRRVRSLKEQIAERKVRREMEIYLLLEDYVNALEKFIKVGSQQVYAAAGLPADGKDLCAVSFSLAEEEVEVYNKLRRLEARLSKLLERATEKANGEARSEEAKEALPIK